MQHTELDSFIIVNEFVIVQYTLKENEHNRIANAFNCAIFFVCPKITEQLNFDNLHVPHPCNFSKQMTFSDSSIIYRQPTKEFSWFVVSLVDRFVPRYGYELITGRDKRWTACVYTLFYVPLQANLPLPSLLKGGVLQNIGG